jgi:hypothetical protein
MQGNTFPIIPDQRCNASERENQVVGQFEIDYFSVAIRKGLLPPSI